MKTDFSTNQRFSKQKNRNAITENIRSIILSRDMESQYLLINPVQKRG